MSARYLYIRVIEAKGIVRHDPVIEPFVVVKLNGQGRKKTTSYKMGVTWWDKTLCVTVKNPEVDWVSVEVREKGLHLFGSDWVGELQFYAHQFKDGKVHQDWFALSKLPNRKHSREARGYLHLAFQMLSSKAERPFTGDELANTPFEEWHAKQNWSFLGNNSRIIPSNTSTSIPKEEKKESKIIPAKKLEQRPPTIREQYHQISKNAHQILITENPLPEEVKKMERLNLVNCLHRGNFDATQGKRYMVCVDGSESAKIAFTHTMKLIDPAKDHLFIVTVREKIPTDFYSPKSKTILTHKMWQAASDIVNKYQDMVKGTNIDYTSIMPVAEDPRVIVCALAKKYKADVIVVGRHKRRETKRGSGHVRSFMRYCQKHSKCSVMVF